MDFYSYVELSTLALTCWAISPKLKKIDVINSQSLDCYLKTYDEEEELRSKMSTDALGSLPDWQLTQPTAIYRTM